VNPVKVEIRDARLGRRLEHSRALKYVLLFGTDQICHIPCDPVDTTIPSNQSNVSQNIRIECCSPPLGRLDKVYQARKGVEGRLEEKQPNGVAYLGEPSRA
jgi:hypothetical protein